MVISDIQFLIQSSWLHLWIHFHGSAYWLIIYVSVNRTLCLMLLYNQDTDNCGWYLPLSLEEYDQYDEDCNLLLKKEALESSQRILCGQKKKTKKASRQRWYWSKHLRHIYLIGYYCKLFLLFSLNISNMVFKAIRNS